MFSQFLLHLLTVCVPLAFSISFLLSFFCWLNLKLLNLIYFIYFGTFCFVLTHFYCLFWKCVVIMSLSSDLSTKLDLINDPKWVCSVLVICDTHNQPQQMRWKKIQIQSFTETKQFSDSNYCEWHFNVHEIVWNFKLKFFILSFFSWFIFISSEIFRNKKNLSNAEAAAFLGWSFVFCTSILQNLPNLVYELSVSLCSLFDCSLPTKNFNWLAFVWWDSKIISSSFLFQFSRSLQCSHTKRNHKDHTEQIKLKIFCFLHISDDIAIQHIFSPAQKTDISLAFHPIAADNVTRHFVSCFFSWRINFQLTFLLSFRFCILWKRSAIIKWHEADVFVAKWR